MVVGVALNFASEVRKLAEPPKSPVLYIKPENTITSHLAPVLHPDGVPAIQPGPSLAVVVGRRARRVPRSQAFDHVKGYTLLNDFSLEEKGFFRPPVRAKCFDSFGPLGSEVLPRDRIENPHDVLLRCRVNGEIRQEGTTRDLVFRIPELIESITAFLTLEEDDVLATGVPPGRVDVAAGDSVTIEIPGLLALTNFVISEAEFHRKA